MDADGVNSTISNRSSTSPITNVFAGASNELTSKNFGANFGVSQLLPWGANYSVAWNNSRGKSNSIYDSPNPFLQSNLSVFDTPSRCSGTSPSTARGSSSSSARRTGR